MTNTMQIVFPLGMNEGNSILEVRSTESKVLYQRGGEYYGKQYEWGLNHYTFTRNKEDTMAALGLTSDEYEAWDQQYKVRFDRTNDCWYRRD